MPKNYFSENRNRLHQAFVKHNYLVPLTNEHLPYAIVEKNNQTRDNTLKEVRIKNIPVAADGAAISYVIDVELTNHLFSAPPGFRTVEKVILVLSPKCLFVIFVELKSAMNSKHLRDVDKKINHSLGRLMLFLSHYLFDDAQFDDCEINISAIVFYNEDWFTDELRKKSDETLDRLDLTKIFQNKKQHSFVTEPLGQELRVRISFEKNPSNTEDFEFDLSNFFVGDKRFVTATQDQITLPINL